MRVCSYLENGERRLGLLKSDAVVPVAALDAAMPHELSDILRREGGLDELKALDAKAKVSDGMSLAALTLDLPVRGSGKIFCLGLNYAAHAAEGGHAKPEYPSFFMRGETSFTAPGQPIVRPRLSEQLDYEAEMTLVIGKKARHVSSENALDYIAGYTCANEGSVREYQRKTSQWTIGKNFDLSGSMGPFFVSADEVPPGGKGLKIECRLNGEVMQSANTDSMLCDVPMAIELLSAALTLEPGDLILTGTPEGVGHARTPQVWMKPGDTVEVEIEGIGLLRNPIVAED